MTIPGTTSSTLSQSLTASASLSSSASFSLTSTLSVTQSSTLSITHTHSVTDSLPLTTSDSLSTSRSVTGTQSLTTTNSQSLTSSTSLSSTGSPSRTHSSSTSSSPSHTDSSSLTISGSPSPSSTVTLTDSVSLTFSNSMTLTDSMSLTNSMSLTSSDSLTVSSSETLSYTESYTESYSKTVSLPLTVTHPLSATISLSLTDSISPTTSISFSLTNSVTESVSTSATETVSTSYSISASNSISLTAYKRLQTITFGKEFVFKNPVTKPSNSDPLINKAVEDAVNKPIWFLFVVCIVAALAAFVLLVLIAIAVYRRWKRIMKEEHQTRRATKYLKRGKRERVALGEVKKYETESDSDDGTQNSSLHRDVVVNFDDLGEAGASAEGALWTSFRKEFVGKGNLFGGKKGGGAKLDKLNVAQFNQRLSDTDPHLMPKKRMNDFVEDVLSTEKEARLRRLQSTSRIFNEATRGNPTSGPADILANSLTALAVAGEALKRHYTQQDGFRRLGNIGSRRDSAIDPTVGENEDLCQCRAGEARLVKCVNRHRRGSVGAGFTGLHPTAVTKPPEEIHDEDAADEERWRGVKEGCGTVVSAAHSVGRIDKPLSDALDEFNAFAFDYGDSLLEQEATPRASPPAAIAATSVVAPINITRKNSINAIHLGHDVNEFDDFDFDEEYDFSHLPGKARTAVTAEAMLGTRFKPKRPQSSPNRSGGAMGDFGPHEFDVDAIAAELGLNDLWAAPPTSPPNSSTPIPPEICFDDEGAQPDSSSRSTFIPAAATRPSVASDLRIVHDDDELDLNSGELDLGDLAIICLQVPNIQEGDHVVVELMDIEGLFDDVDIE